MSTAKIHISDVRNVQSVVAAVQDALNRLLTPDAIRALSGGGCRSVSIYPPQHYGQTQELARIDLERSPFPSHADSALVTIFLLPLRTRMGAAIVGEDVWMRLRFSAAGADTVKFIMSRDATYASARLLTSVQALLESTRPVAVSVY